MLFDLSWVPGTFQTNGLRRSSVVHSVVEDPQIILFLAQDDLQPGGANVTELTL